MNSYTCSVVSLIIGAIGFLWQMIHVIWKDGTVTKHGLVLLLFASFMVCFGWTGLSMAKHEQWTAHIQDSTTQSNYIKKIDSSNSAYNDSIKAYHVETTILLAEYGLKLDSTRHEIVKSNPTVPHFGAPHSCDGVIKKAVGDSIYTTVSVANSGLEADSMNITIYVLLRKQGDTNWYKQKVIFDKVFNVNIGKDMFVDVQCWTKNHGPFIEGYDEYYLIEGVSINKKIKFSTSYVYYSRVAIGANGNDTHFSIYGGEFSLREALKRAVYIR